MKRYYQNRNYWTHGAITVLAAVLAIVLVGMVAFCVDIGYVLSAKEEMQRSADSAALAACWEFGQTCERHKPSAAAGYARHGGQYASLNHVTGNAMSLNANTSNDPNGDVVFGYISDFKDPQSAFQTDGANGYNAVKVRLRKNSTNNGEVPYFFAGLWPDRPDLAAGDRWDRPRREGLQDPGRRQQPRHSAIRARSANVEQSRRQ